MTAQDLENEISNLDPSTPTRTMFYVGNVNDRNRPLLKQWLIASGAQERKVLTASDYVLANAYRAGERYIAAMNSEDNDRRFGKPKRGVRPIRFGDLDADLQPEVKAELGLGLIQHQAPRTEAKAEVQGPTPENKPLAVVDAAAIARAADAVITPRIEQARNQLRSELRDSVVREIDAKFADAVSKAQIGDALRGQILDLVSSTATEIITKAIPKRLDLVLPNGEVRHLDAEPRHKIFDEVLQLLSSGEHVYLVGNAGTGKTHMFKQLGRALDRPVTILGQALTKYEFSGHIGPTGEYVKTLLRTAVEEGHLLAIDEIDMSAAAAIGFLNSLTANRYVAFPDKMVEAHPDFIVIAAANTYGRGATSGFVGRNPLDAASLDRFSYIECGYDTDLELQIYGSSEWLRYVHKVRSAIEDLGQQHIISMRAIERGLRCLEIGMSAERTCEVALWRGLAKDTISKVKNTAGTFAVRDLKIVNS